MRSERSRRKDGHRLGAGTAHPGRGGCHHLPLETDALAEAGEQGPSGTSEPRPGPVTLSAFGSRLDRRLHPPRPARRSAEGRTRPSLPPRLASRSQGIAGMSNRTERARGVGPGACRIPPSHRRPDRGPRASRRARAARCPRSDEGCRGETRRGRLSRPRRSPMGEARARGASCAAAVSPPDQAPCARGRSTPASVTTASSGASVSSRGRCSASCAA